MRLSVDSSSFAKRCIQESGSDRLDDLLQHASDLARCIISVPEGISGLNRGLREGALTDRDSREAKRQLLADVRDATVLQFTPAVISGAVKLLENEVLHALDALHVACAQEWKADLFVSADRTQFDAASQNDPGPARERTMLDL